MDIKEISNKIALEILTHKGRQRLPRGKRFQSLIHSIEILIRDSVSLKLSGARKVYASINKGAGHYSQSRYNSRLSYRIHIKLAYNGMCSLGYLQEVKAGVSHGPVGLYLTKYKATMKLLRHFRDIEPAVLPTILGSTPLDQTVRVQISLPLVDALSGRPRKQKQFVEYEDTEDTYVMRSNLRRINEAIGRRWIDLELSDAALADLQRQMSSTKRSEEGQETNLNLTRTSLYRVFNDIELRTGGRFYGGWWQTIPKSYRRHLIIDGKRTVEADYSNLHPAILYAQRQLEPPEDAYSGLLPQLPRAVAKQAFNAMLNAKAPMMKQPRGMKLSQFDIRWEDVVSAFMERHAPISDAFFTGSGGVLQRIDSDLAERVMLRFLDYGRPVPVLPVHDSFILHHGYQHELKAFMELEFYEMFGQEINVELEYGGPTSNHDASVPTNLDDLLDTLPGYEKRLMAHQTLKEF